MRMKKNHLECHHWEVAVVNLYWLLGGYIYIYIYAYWYSRSSLPAVLFQGLKDCFYFSLSSSQHWSRYKDLNLSLISRQKDRVACLLSYGFPLPEIRQDRAGGEKEGLSGVGEDEASQSSGCMLRTWELPVRTQCWTSSWMWTHKVHLSYRKLPTTLLGSSKASLGRWYIGIYDEAMMRSLWTKDN